MAAIRSLQWLTPLSAFLCLLTAQQMPNASPKLGTSRPLPTFGVNGNVYDETRRPIAGAVVKLLLNIWGGSQCLDTATTNSNGRFEMRGPVLSSQDPGRGLRIEVSAPNFAISCVDRLKSGFGVYDIGPVFLLKPVLLTGIVKTESGEPVRNAKIWARLGERTWWPVEDTIREGPVAITNENGLYKCNTLGPGKVMLGVESDRRADEVKTVTLRDDSNSCDFEVKPEIPCAGSVIDSEMKPIAGALVSAGARGFWRTEAATASDGKFKITGLGELHQKVGVNAKSFVSQFTTLSDVKDLGNIQIKLTKSQSFVITAKRIDGSTPPAIKTVSVRDSSPGDPFCGNADDLHWSKHKLDDPTIEILQPSIWRIYWDAGEVIVDSKRLITQMGSPSCVEIETAEGDEKELQFSTNGAHDVQAIFDKTGAIEGKVVTEDGKPLSNTIVILNHWSAVGPHMETITGPDGGYRFEGVGIARHTHFVKVKNSLYEGRSKWVAVSPESTTKNIDFTAYRRPQITGKITIDGHPPCEPIVIGLGEFQTNQVVSAGTFGFGISDPEGNYVVVPHYDRMFTVVPKNRTTPGDGCYRDFLSEFPETPLGKWPWQAGVPDGKDAHLDINWK